MDCFYCAPFGVIVGSDLENYFCVSASYTHGLVRSQKREYDSGIEA